jgi:hypothetical protein
MAKLDRRKLKQIVERDMPGFTIAESGAAAVDTETRPESVPQDMTPEITELRRKFLGADADTNAAFYGADAGAGGAADDGGSAIVLTRPKHLPADAASEGLGPKAVVISGGKVIAKQG